jgi:hypothetical protein
MTSELYNVDNYTDSQLYDILDINSPTDRELEAKILHLIRKYMAMQTAAGNQLSKFFEDIYKRFFSSDEEVEGFENPKEDQSDPLQKQNITAIQAFEYAQDKLQINPLIKQTITRVISIDSQYRDVTTSPFTTNFSFDLSEPLRDVVSLKLYSIQIPYTWYTISKSYGSNFFYLKPSNPSISQYPKYSYKIEIAPGTYSPTQLISAINTSFQDLSNSTASDVDFNGQPLLLYDMNTSKTTFNLNLQNTFNETYYSFSFPEGNNNSISKYLGFTNQIYYPNSIKSNQTAYESNIISSSGEKAQNYIIDGSNNYFTVIQYIGSSQKNGYDGNHTILNRQTVYLLDRNSNYNTFVGNATRTQVIQAVQDGLMMNTSFDASSNIYIYDNIETGYSYFILTIIWNRNTIKYVPNAKTVVIFPDENPRRNQYINANETFCIWNYNSAATYNCFFFDVPINQYSQFLSETEYTNSTFDVDLSTNIVFTCNIPGYNINGVNDFSLNIPSGKYSTLQFADAITQTINTNNSTLENIFNNKNTVASIDNSNRFSLSVDMIIPFTNKDYQIFIDPSKNSVLTAELGFESQNPLRPNYTGKFPTSKTIAGNSIIGNITNNPGGTGYAVDSTPNKYILTVIPIGQKNKFAGNIDIRMLNSTRTYNSIDSFLSAIQTSIQKTQVSIPAINSYETPFSRSTVGRSQNNGADLYDISINIQCDYSLTEAIYDISFVDIGKPFVQSPWNQLNINSGYNLYNVRDDQNGYAIVKANYDISANTISVVNTDSSNQFTIKTIPNSHAPSDTITVSVKPGVYTITELYTAINEAFDKNPKTYGSYITKYIDENNVGYSRLWINVNNIYTSADYILAFWDPVSFITCYSGSSSVQNTTWDATVGWILGFRDNTQYNLTQASQTRNSNFPTITYYMTSINGSYIYTPTFQGANESIDQLLLSASVQLTGDTTLSTNLFNYFLISLDDYIQNHLNDGLVTITRSQNSIQMPDYQYTTSQTCDPATNTLITSANTQPNSNNVTNAQLYAVNQSVQSQQPTIQKYSPGPYIKDLFGIIPVKPPSNPGDTYTEFGGSLQNQTRMYFGPVNIRKMSIQLLTDRGDIVDLNGSNWTFSFVCEQLYRSSSAPT